MEESEWSFTIFCWFGEKDLGKIDREEQRVKDAVSGEKVSQEGNDSDVLKQWVSTSSTSPFACRHELRRNVPVLSFLASMMETVPFAASQTWSKLDHVSLGKDH